MLRNILLSAVLLAPACALAQTKTPTHFDVIAIKPHKGGDNSSGWRWNSVGLEMTNVALGNMIAASSKVQHWLVFGVPQWAQTARWDISAKVTDPEMKPIEKLTPDERQALIGSVLVDRFGLVSHKETKVQPVFLMTVLPGGLKVKQSAPLPAGEPPPKFGRGSVMINNGVMEARAVTMPFVADMLTGQVERTVLDKTGVSGEYDFDLKWQPDDRPKGEDNGADDAALPSLVEAVKEQLGLKMTSDRAPVPTVVVDNLMQPEEN